MERLLLYRTGASGHGAYERHREMVLSSLRASFDVEEYLAPSIEEGKQKIIEASKSVSAILVVGGDGTLISADVKLVKPQPEIYRLLLEKFSLTAQECFFIDDSPANIEGALMCGIPGAVFHGDVALLRKDLRAAGVTIAE